MACKAMVGSDRCGDDNDVTGTKATPAGASIAIVTATTIEDFIAEGSSMTREVAEREDFDHCK
jgi:hypothetical protein